MTQVEPGDEIVVPEAGQPPKPERRRYNRRTNDAPGPPYFEVFSRIAAALETMSDVLEARLADPRRDAPGGDEPPPQRSAR